MGTVKKVPIPLDQRLRSFVRGPLIGVVWLASAALCVTLLRGRPVALEHSAWVPPVEYEVSTSRSGVLGSVLVQPFQAVRKGELVAQLDSRPLEARLATSQAEVLRLRAQITDAREVAQAEHQQARVLAEQEALSDDVSWRIRLAGDLLRSFNTQINNQRIVFNYIFPRKTKIYMQAFPNIIAVKSQNIKPFFSKQLFCSHRNCRLPRT